MTPPSMKQPALQAPWAQTCPLAQLPGGIPLNGLQPEVAWAGSQMRHPSAGSDVKLGTKALAMTHPARHTPAAHTCPAPHPPSGGGPEIGSQVRKLASGSQARHGFPGLEFPAATTRPPIKQLFEHAPER